MILSEDEAASRLRDLRRQREDLDRAIADLALYLELGRRLKLSPPTGLETGRLGDADVSSEGRPSQANDLAAAPDAPSWASAGANARRYGRDLIDAALVLLQQAGKPLHARDLLDLLSAQGYALPGKDPVAALNTRLWKRAGTGGPIRRVGKAVYALADRSVR